MYLGQRSENYYIEEREHTSGKICVFFTLDCGHNVRNLSINGPKTSLKIHQSIAWEMEGVVKDVGGLLEWVRRW